MAPWYHHVVHPVQPYGGSSSSSSTHSSGHMVTNTTYGCNALQPNMTQSCCSAYNGTITMLTNAASLNATKVPRCDGLSSENAQSFTACVYNLQTFGNNDKSHNTPNQLNGTIAPCITETTISYVNGAAPTWKLGGIGGIIAGGLLASWVLSTTCMI